MKIENKNGMRWFFSMYFIIIIANFYMALYSKFTINRKESKGNSHLVTISLLQ